MSIQTDQDLTIRAIVAAALGLFFFLSLYSGESFLEWFFGAKKPDKPDTPPHGDDYRPDFVAVEQAQNELIESIPTGDTAPMNWLPPEDDYLAEDDALIDEEDDWDHLEETAVDSQDQIEPDSQSHFIEKPKPEGEPARDPDSDLVRRYFARHYCQPFVMQPQAIFISPATWEEMTNPKTGKTETVQEFKGILPSHADQEKLRERFPEMVGAPSGLALFPLPAHAMKPYGGTPGAIANHVDSWTGEIRTEPEQATRQAAIERENDTLKAQNSILSAQLKSALDQKPGEELRGIE